MTKTPASPASFVQTFSINGGAQISPDAEYQGEHLGKLPLTQVVWGFPGFRKPAAHVSSEVLKVRQQS